MTKSEKEILANVLKATLERTDEMFKSKEVSHAYIIGYLQGSIRGAINELTDSGVFNKIIKPARYHEGTVILDGENI
jgi:hypothetical protein